METKNGRYTVRYTRKSVESVFDLLLETIGGRRAASYKDVGAYQLDYNSLYGGYVIHRIVNDNGGVSTPFGLERCSAREFVARVAFLRDGIAEKRHNVKP